MPSASAYRKPGKSSFAAQLRALGDVAPADFDVEDAERLGGRGGGSQDGLGNGSDDDADVDDDVVDDNGREHYVAVGRSRLRDQQGRREDRPAGAAYKGQRTSRADLYDADDFSVSDDDGEEDDDDLEDGLDDLLDGNSEDEDDLEEDDDDESKLSGSDQELGSEDDQDDAASSVSSGSDANQAAEARRLMAEDRAALVRDVAARASADVEKGRAAKRQMEVFEGLLDTRIKLQKALQAANLFIPLAKAADDDDTTEETDAQADEHDTTAAAAVSSAEKSCLELIDSLLTLRDGMLARDAPAVDGAAARPRKRKYSELNTEDVTLDALWEEVSTSRPRLSSWRDAVLQKWSARVSASTSAVGAAAGPNKKFKALGRLDDPTFGVVAQLADAKSDRAKLIRRTQIPRYRPAADAAATEQELAPETYDDGDFYGELLRELIDSRTLDSVGDDGGDGMANDVVAGGARTAAMRNAQHTEQRRRQLAARGGVAVDTRASKGRKLRHHVHEKLQNFVAPDPTALKWHDAQIDELFGSLLGQSVRMAEEDDAESQAVDHERNGDVDAPVVAGEDFRLFG